MATKAEGPDPSTFGVRLKSFREAQGLSVARLAQISGITQGYLFQIEAGKRQTPGLDTLTSLAKALRLTLDDLAGFDVNAEPPPIEPEVEQRFQTLEKGLLKVNQEMHSGFEAILERLPASDLRRPAPKKKRPGQGGGSRS